MTPRLRVPALALHVVIAIAMALSLLVTRASHSMSHDPVVIAAAEKHAHAKLAAMNADHGHVHDDGVAPEREPGHVHEHNPADHSHETPALVAKVTQAFAQLTRSRSARAFPPPAPGERTRLERPPKMATHA